MENKSKVKQKSPTTTSDKAAKNGSKEKGKRKKTKSSKKKSDKNPTKCASSPEDDMPSGCESASDHMLTKPGADPGKRASQATLARPRAVTSQARTMTSQTRAVLRPAASTGCLQGALQQTALPRLQAAGRAPEQNPSLRWEHALQDEALEAERMREYKAARRKRYIEAGNRQSGGANPGRPTESSQGAGRGPQEGRAGRSSQEGRAGSSQEGRVGRGSQEGRAGRSSHAGKTGTGARPAAREEVLPQVALSAALQPQRHALECQ